MISMDGGHSTELRTYLAVQQYLMKIRLIMHQYNNGNLTAGNVPAPEFPTLSPDALPSKSLYSYSNETTLIQPTDLTVAKNNNEPTKTSPPPPPPASLPPATTSSFSPVTPSTSPTLTSVSASSRGSKPSKLFQCELCNYTSNRKNNLKRHFVTMHTDLGFSRLCCGRRYRNKGEFRAHTRLAHAAGFRCQWDDCAKTFPRKALMERHMMTHTGRKTHVCVVNRCSYATSHKSNLARHMAIHERKDFNESVWAFEPHHYAAALSVRPDSTTSTPPPSHQRLQGSIAQ